jgi:phage gpG-like protein
MAIQIILVGDDLVKARFEKLGPESHSRVAREVQRLTINLQSKVVNEKLSGQVLKNRTGTLRRSITQKVEDTGDRITGIVGADMNTARYAAAHEYGFTGTVNVREHARRITQVFGRPVTPHEIIVGAHSMRMNLPERSYLRSSLSEMEADILAGLNEAVAEAIA